MYVAVVRSRKDRTQNATKLNQKDFGLGRGEKMEVDVIEK